ncbi:MAG TPA: GntR family transcriptional regulator [Sphaerochaeta sp.]|nr:GntR family transcriptional regulator [Sphaerochaeta sp.]
MAKDTSLKSRAYFTIKDKIINCEYRPGAMLTEERLIEELNLTRTPIRDAVGRLEQEGLLTIKPKKGILVTPLHFDEATHLLEARMLYETFAIREYGALIDEHTMLTLYRDLLTVIKYPTKEGSNSVDSDLHQVIIDALPNTFLRAHYQMIDDQIKRLKIRLRIITGVYQRRLKETQEEHLAIILACLKKDWVGAEQALIAHLTASNNTVIELFLSKIDSTEIAPKSGKIIA